MKNNTKIILILTILTISFHNVLNENVLKYVVNPAYKLPESLMNTYSEFIKLEEIEELEEINKPKTCNFSDIVSKKTEELVTQVIFQKNCIPDAATFKEILENGWEKLRHRIVKEFYLNNKIDPSQSIYNYVGSNEDKIKTLSKLVVDYNKLKKLNVRYTYENLENSVNVQIKMPDFSYTPEYYSFFCKDNLLIVHAIFKSKGSLYRIKDSNRLFDNIEGECTYTYNYFTFSFEVLLHKKNKLKLWSSLFKTKE